MIVNFALQVKFLLRIFIVFVVILLLSCHVSPNIGVIRFENLTSSQVSMGVGDALFKLNSGQIIDYYFYSNRDGIIKGDVPCITSSISLYTGRIFRFTAKVTSIGVSLVITSDNLQE